MSTTEAGIGGRNIDPRATGYRPLEMDDMEPREIEREIDATRADMKQTLDALEHRLSFDRLVELTIGRIKDRGGEFAGNLTDAATQNPVPALLTSIGLGWMMLTSRRGVRSEHRFGNGDHSARDSSGLGDSLASTRDTVRRAVDSTRGTLQQAADSSHEAIQRATESLRAGSETAKEQFDVARERMDRLLDEQPLLLGAFGMAVGAVIGAMLPTTENEDRWLGPVRDKASDLVAETARPDPDPASPHQQQSSADSEARPL
jgi:ElaB/YqjD/DUF883 family membrane-anchored ribosome-binding protein